MTPFEDLIIDGLPAVAGSLTGLSSSAVVNAMAGKDQTLLIASSTMPYGVATAFSVQVRPAMRAAFWL